MILLKDYYKDTYWLYIRLRLSVFKSYKNTYPVRKRPIERKRVPCYYKIMKNRQAVEI